MFAGPEPTWQGCVQTACRKQARMSHWIPPHLSLVFFSCSSSDLIRAVFFIHCKTLKESVGSQIFTQDDREASLSDSVFSMIFFIDLVLCFHVLNHFSHELPHFQWISVQRECPIVEAPIKTIRSIFCLPCVSFLPCLLNLSQD